MELVRMKLADLRPNDANLRAELHDIDALADLLDLTPGAPGEPVLPLVAVRDANVGRIVDGHRRHAAMKKRGKVGECWVCLCDDMDEAGTVVTMLLCNCQERLDEGELSRGLQESLLLGVPERDVDKLAGKKVSRALRRVAERNGNRAAQVTIDQALAADEVLEAGGTQEDYDEVMAAGPDPSYLKRRIIDRIEAEKRSAELEEALAEVAGTHGLAVADKKPKGAMLRSSFYRLDAKTVREQGPTWAAVRATLVRPKAAYYSWELYDEPREMSEAEQEIAEAKNALRRSRTAGEKRRAQWLHDKLVQGGSWMPSLPATQELVERHYGGERFDLDAKEFLQRAGVEDNDLPDMANVWMCATAWCRIDHVINDDCDYIYDGHQSWSAENAAQGVVDVLTALERDGYEPDELELALKSLCEKRLAEWKRK